MTVIRNVQIKLEVAPEDRIHIDETFEQFRIAAQFVSDYGWASDPSGIIEGRHDLHDATYDEVRRKTDLTANHVQAARNLAADALEHSKNRLFNGRKANKPVFRGSVIVFDGRTVSYRDNHCTLSTVNGRISAEFVLPSDTENTPYGDYWESDDWKCGQATLHKRDGTYYLHVSMRNHPEAERSKTEYGAVLGVDLNVDGFLAVTSTGEFLGNADYLNHKRTEYELRRGDLQQTGTRSAHLTIQSLSDRFSNWTEDYLHRVSLAILREARAHDCVAIAFENLDHICERISNASKFQQWAFRLIREYTTYKAETYGIRVKSVAPQYTSQRCSHSDCGFIHEENRHGDDFDCMQCGKELHSDYNAARNIAWRLVQNWLTSGAGRANCQVALKSGTLNANGEFTPATA